MKKLQFLSVILVCLTLSGCRALTFEKRMMEVTEGMSQNQVKNILGNPSQRAFEAGIEVWEYVIAYSQEENRICIISFDNKKVTSMETFLSPVGGHGPHKPHHRPHHRKNPHR